MLRDSSGIVISRNKEYSIGREVGWKRSYSELMLPSLQFEKDTSTITGKKMSSLFGCGLNFKRSRTAPSSPTGVHSITPITSPAKQHPRGSPISNISSIFSSPLLKDNNKTKLPSLRHLRLLPRPEIQNNSLLFPDTSSRTQVWRQILVRWCKETENGWYHKIKEEVSSANPSDNSGLNVLANVSSIIAPQDHFYELSNSSVTKQIAITPPLSPKNEPIRVTKKFSPILSEKLVQSIINKRVMKGAHKKTNSSLVRELKKLLESRSIYSSAVTAKESHPPSRESSKHSFEPPNTEKLAVNNVKFAIPPVREHVSLPGAQIPQSRNISSNVSSTDICTSLKPQRKTSAVAAATLNTIEDAITVENHVQTGDNPKSPSSPSSKSPSMYLLVKKCFSCQSTDSPCWRPSWSEKKHEQLCNSCGLRYKKTRTRCTNSECFKIPSKGELTMMKSNPKIEQTLEDGTVTEGLCCLYCNSITQTSE